MNKNFNMVLFFAVALFCFAGCNFKKKKVQSPIGYDLSKPYKFLMPESLFEISGITFSKGNPDSIFAIQDEDGKFFGLAWGIKKQQNTRFGKKDDYEDVTIVRDQVYVLKSDGTLFTFPFAKRHSAQIDSTLEYSGLLPVGEYEGMYGDDSTGNIYIICKDCKGEDEKDQISGYVIKTTDAVTQAGTFKINVKEIEAMGKGKLKRGFKPSALARNPLTGDWYIVSSISKLLVVTDKNWKVKESIEISRNMFSQPEGLAFDNAGNLYISNEGDDLSQGNILKFTRMGK